MRLIVVRVLAALALGLPCSGLLSPIAWSQNAVKFVIPVSSGGVLDLLARTLADQIARKQGVNVVVENRAGGATAVAVQAAAHAAADGYTILIPFARISGRTTAAKGRI